MTKQMTMSDRVRAASQRRQWNPAEAPATDGVDPEKVCLESDDPVETCTTPDDPAKPTLPVDAAA